MMAGDALERLWADFFSTGEGSRMNYYERIGAMASMVRGESPPPVSEEDYWFGDGFDEGTP